MAAKFNRVLIGELLTGISKQKVSLLVGPRRVGKTEMLKEIERQTDKKVLRLNGEDDETLALLENRSMSNYARLLQGYNMLMIDEAQFVPDIGLKAKLMIDSIEPLHIVLTGSSAFHLMQHGAPLTGRTLTYQLFPLAQMELKHHESLLQTRQLQEERLIYGAYPEVLNQPTLEEKKAYLNELVNTYLLRDLLAFDGIRQPQKIYDLLKLIAFQTGNEVSMDELGRQLALSKNTVERYLDLLSKVFILYKRTAFARNLRKEVAKSQKWYFYDNGIRNAVIQQFQPLALRQDVGALWEHYLMAERMKYLVYKGAIVNSYFWRTYDQQEIDLLEESNGELHGYEMKWQQHPVKAPAAFARAYPLATFEAIHRDNYLDWIGA